MAGLMRRSGRRGRRRATLPRAIRCSIGSPFIPLDRYVLKRIVGLRALVDPITGRYLFTWRRLAAALGADHKAIQRWHRDGVELIVAELHRQNFPFPA
jgi:hypothetical protein